MNTAKEHITASLPQQSTFNLANTIRDIISDPTLTQGASRVLVQLVLSAGRKGWTWYLIETLGVLVKSSRTQVKVYLKELVDKNRLNIVRRPGRSSVYQIVGIYNKSSEVGRFSGHIKQSFKSKSNVIERPNGISSNHQESNPCVIIPAGIDAKTSIHLQKVKNDFHTDTIVTESSAKSIHNKPVKPVNFLLVKEILALTNDHKSVRCWIKFVRSAPEQIVQLAIHSLKSALQSETVYHAGKYLIGIIKRLCPEMFNSGHKVSLRQPEQFSDASYYPKAAVDEPTFERNEELNLSSIQAIRALLAKREQLCQA